MKKGTVEIIWCKEADSWIFILKTRWRGSEKFKTVAICDNFFVTTAKDIEADVIFPMAARWLQSLDYDIKEYLASFIPIKKKTLKKFSDALKW